MGLGYQKSRRHAGRYRLIISQLKSHADWMALFVADGFSREEASARAMIMVRSCAVAPSKDVSDAEK